MYFKFEEEKKIAIISSNDVNFSTGLMQMLVSNKIVVDMFLQCNSKIV